MTDDVFESYSQNGEDVVLWRALRNVPQGRYIDVGANKPVLWSITYAFYQRGWRGITIEPIHEYADEHRAERPGDLLVEAVVSDSGDATVVLHEIPGGGLSTIVDTISSRHADAGWEVRDVVVPVRRLDDILVEAQWSGLDIHFMTVDVEGAEPAVLNSIDLRVWRPWVIVIEATAPMTSEPTHADWEAGVLAAGYQFCLFDGLSRFYVADERAEELGHDLSFSPSVFDRYDSIESRETAQRVAQAAEDAIRWRALAMTRWSQVISNEIADRAYLAAHVEELRAELIAVRETLSWRVTKPLRALRGSAKPPRTP